MKEYQGHESLHKTFRSRIIYCWSEIADKTKPVTQRQTNLGEKTGVKGTPTCHTATLSKFLANHVRVPAQLHSGIKDNLH